MRLGGGGREIRGKVNGETLALSHSPKTLNWISGITGKKRISHRSLHWSRLTSALDPSPHGAHVLRCSGSFIIDLDTIGEVMYCVTSGLLVTLATCMPSVAGFSKSELSSFALSARFSVSCFTLYSSCGGVDVWRCGGVDGSGEDQLCVQRTLLGRLLHNVELLRGCGCADVWMCGCVARKGRGCTLHTTFGRQWRWFASCALVTLFTHHLRISPSPPRGSGLPFILKHLAFRLVPYLPAPSKRPRCHT
eukprot:358152-Chlamydomonas_euryale.AAC.10